MPVKELSTFPPDRWIRELNRQYPSLWADLRKARENPGKIVRKNTEGMKLLSGIPDWCIMPTMFPFLTITERYGEAYYLLHMHEIMTIGSMYLWRAGRGVYRFSPEVYDVLIHQPLSGDLPIECLYHLPEWAVYIETPGIMFGSCPISVHVLGCGLLVEFFLRDAGYGMLPDEGFVHLHHRVDLLLGGSDFRVQR